MTARQVILLACALWATGCLTVIATVQFRMSSQTYIAGE